LLGVGYIIGIQITSLVFLGGAIAWLVAVPLASAVHPELDSLSAAVTAQQIWASETRYLGVGAMLVGGVATLWGLRGKITGLARKARLVRARHEAVATAREETDLPAAIVLPAVGGAIPVIFVICWLLSGSLWLSAALAFALALIGFFATAVAGYLSGIVGASNNPVSGVTVIVLLAIAILLKFLGVSIGVGPPLAIMAGAVVCTAAAMAGDSMQDLATGYHVGATPSRLEIAVLLGAIVSSFVMAPILNLLIRGYGIAGMPDAGTQALAAPQAFLMAKVAQGVFGGSLPWRIIAAGAALAIVLIFIGRSLERRNVRWRMPVMPVALGLYLPLGLSVTIFLGSLAGIRRHENSSAAGAGLLFAAGLVAGEALMGVVSGALVTAGIKLPLF
jgi:putative OPT family oligopeptide transporter